MPKPSGKNRGKQEEARRRRKKEEGENRKNDVLRSATKSLKEASKVVEFEPKNKNIYLSRSRGKEKGPGSPGAGRGPWRGQIEEVVVARVVALALVKLSRSQQGRS